MGTWRYRVYSGIIWNLEIQGLKWFSWGPGDKRFVAVLREPGDKGFEVVSRVPGVIKETILLSPSPPLLQYSPEDLQQTSADRCMTDKRRLQPSCRLTSPAAELRTDDE